MEKVKFTFTTMARTVLMAFAFLSFSLGLHAQSTYPTPATGTACAGASVTSVNLIDDGCNVPSKVEIEFLAGGTTSDASAIDNHTWQIAFATTSVAGTSSGSWATAPIPLDDARFTRTGNSLKGQFSVTDFSLKSGSGSALTSWADSTITFFVFQSCDAPDAGVVAPVDSVAPSDRVKGQAGASISAWDDALVENKLELVRYKDNLTGTVDSALCGTGNSTFYLDPLLGEIDTIWSGTYNDADSTGRTQKVTVCLESPMGVPNYENFDLVFTDGAGNAINDDGGYSITAGKDSFLVDSLGIVGGAKCWDVTFYANGDGTNDFGGATSPTGMGFITVSSTMVACATPADLAVSDVKANDFTAKWSIAGGTSGHKFRVVMYQGDPIVNGTLGNSRPDTSSAWVYDQIFDATALSSDGTNFTFNASENYGNLLACTSYQIWVAQICDGMSGVVDGSWVGAQLKTWQTDVAITKVETDANCPDQDGQVVFTIAGGPCTPKQIQVFSADSLSQWMGQGDTARWYSYNGPTDSLGFGMDANNNITYTLDSLMEGTFTFTVVVSDTIKPDSSYYSETITVNIGSVDNEGPTADIGLEDYSYGPWWSVDSVGTVTYYDIDNGTIEGSSINLGVLKNTEGSCGVELDFLMNSVADNCSDSENLTVSVVGLNGTNVEYNHYQGYDDFGDRTVLVRLGSGDFTFEIQITDEAGNVNKFTFTGTVEDVTAPVVTISGSQLVEISECAETTDVYFTVDADDACGDVASTTVTANGTSVTGDANGLYKVEDQGVGTVTVVATATDAAGLSATKTFVITVQQTNTPVAPYIVGAGDIHTVIPVCDADGMIDVGFDLFVIDDCGSATMSTVTSAGVTIAQTLGSSSYTAEDLTPGTYAVTATASTGATYSFTITVEAAMADAAPDITLPGNLTFTLPDCDASTEVNLAIHVDDDCADLETLAGNTVVTLDGATLTPNIDLSGSVNGQAVLTFTVPISSADNGAELKVTTTDGSQSSTAQANITVLQNAVATDYVCEDNIIIKLDEDDCGATVTPSMVLKGDESTICNNLLQVVVEKFDANGNFDGYEIGHVTAVGTRRYMVYSSALDIPASALLKTSQFFVNRNDMICWGTLTTEDKTRPELTCPEDRYTADRPTAYNVWEGSIAAGREFYPQVFSCYQATTADGYISEIPTEPVPPYFPPYVNPHDAHYYSTWTFRPVVDGKYTINLFAEFNGGMSLFQQPGLYSDINEPGYPRSNSGAGVGDGWFDASLPCSNVVAFGESTFGSDDPFAGLGNPDNWIANDNDWAINGDAVQRMSLPMNAGKEYTLVVTSREPFVEGDFTVLVERDGATTQAHEILRYWNPTADQWGNEVARWTTYPRTVELLDQPLYCDDINSIVINPTDDRCYTIVSDYTNPTWNGVTGGMIKNDAVISDFLADRLLSTGFPTVSDNCGPITVCVSDVVSQHGDCGELYITRSFSATDQYGNKAEFSPGVYTCTQRINFSVPSISNLTLPHFTAYLECDEAFATDAAGNPSPSVTGYPFMRSAFGYHDLAQEWCNLAATYSDEAKIPGCDNGYKLRREWTVLDWCRPGKSVIYNQLIKVGDFTPPVINAGSIVANNAGLDDSDLLTYSVSPFDCDADFRVPVPAVSDNCSDAIAITFDLQIRVAVPVLDHFGNQVGTNVEWQTIREGNAGDMVRGLAISPDYRYIFTATDGCDNSSTAEVYFQVEDRIEPIPVCDGGITVTLGGGSYDLDNNVDAGGYARIMKQDLQEGISDNCGVASYHVRRAGTTVWGDMVEFSCADAGNEVEVELRVIDLSGNESLCWLNVLVEDKTKPYCVAPDDFWGYCTDLPEDFNPPATTAEYTAMSDAAKAALHAQLDDLFGASEVTDNCNNVTTYQSVTAISWHCGAGTISRRFWGVDGYGNQTPQVCVQTITIDLQHSYGFTFPADATGSCAAVIDVYDVNPQNTGCDLLSVYTTDRTYEASGDECYKVFRTFEVVNWCQFNGTDLALANPFIVGRDEDGDGKPGNRSVSVSFSNVEDENVYQDFIVVTSGTKTRREGPICTPSHNGPTCPASYTQAAGPAGYNLTYSPGYYQYTQVIAVYDNQAPTVSATVEAEYCAYDCDGASVVVAISVSDDCTPTDLSVAAYVWPNGNEAAKFAITATLTQVSSGILPVGAHKLEVVAFDGCGNTNRVVEDLVISDCKAPSPTCISGIAVELMPYDANGDGTIDDGRMAIHASDYVQGEAFDCAGPVKYSIHLSREPQTAGELSLLDQIEQFVVNGDMELGDLLDSDHASDLVTCDDAGKTLMAVIAAWDANGNGDYCETFLIVQDNMNLCGGAAGPSVAGLISTETNNTVENVEVNLSGQMTDNMLTTTDGNYVFVNLQSGYDYTITPLLDDDHDNGVTTFDLIEIGKHILTVKPLGSPYKMIAADVDNNRSITTLDLIQLRRLILSVDTEFANNTSWRFVDASYQFPNPSNPWATSFPEIININDLDGSELSGDFVAIKVGDVTLDAKANSLMTSGRSVAGQFNLDVANVAMKAGGEYTVAFNASNLSDIQGYQFTLNLDESVELVDINYGVAVEENFGTRFASEGAITTSWNGAAESGMLFELVLRAKADVQLSEVVDVTSRYTVAEAYNNNGQLLDVAINFNNGATASSVELYQNTPNPFKGETVVGFNLPEAASATLTITDVTGKVLRVVRGEYARGYNQVNLNSAQLPATGVLYYTLETGDFTATKKMVIVE